VRLSSKDRSRVFTEAESFNGAPELAGLLGFQRSYPLMFITETTEASSSNIRLNKLMIFLKEILHEEEMISENEIKVI
jgi:hypothetical protein